MTLEFCVDFDIEWGKVCFTYTNDEGETVWSSRPIKICNEGKEHTTEMYDRDMTTVIADPASVFPDYTPIDCDISIQTYASFICDTDNQTTHKIICVFIDNVLSDIELTDLTELPENRTWGACTPPDCEYTDNPGCLNGKNIIVRTYNCDDDPTDATIVLIDPETNETIPMQAFTYGYCNPGRKIMSDPIDVCLEYPDTEIP